MGAAVLSGILLKDTMHDLLPEGLTHYEHQHWAAA